MVSNHEENIDRILAKYNSYKDFRSGDLYGYLSSEWPPLENDVLDDYIIGLVRRLKRAAINQAGRGIAETGRYAIWVETIYEIIRRVAMHIQSDKDPRTTLPWLMMVSNSLATFFELQDMFDPFRQKLDIEGDPNCQFCRALSGSRVVKKFGYVVAIRDKNPVTKDHLLIITERHIPDYFSMHEEERRDAERLLYKLRDEIAERDQTVTGFNIGANCGESAGQTIWHAHIHLIPRRDGDTPDPRGGVRGVIPERMDYGE